jgi:hypothetical protein
MPGTVLDPNEYRCQKLRTLMRLRGCCYKRQAKRRGSFARVGEIPFPGPSFIVLRAQIAKWGAMGEEMAGDARDLVGGGDDGRLGTEAGPHPPVVGPQAIVAATDRLRREPKGLAGAIAGLQGAPAQHFPPEISWWGASPSQEQKAFAFGHFQGPKPISERIVCAVLAFKPGMATRSTPSCSCANAAVGSTGAPHPSLG